MPEDLNGQTPGGTDEAPALVRQTDGERPGSPSTTGTAWRYGPATYSLLIA